MKRYKFREILNLLYHALRGRESDRIIVGGRIVLDLVKSVLDERNAQKAAESPGPETNEGE